MVAESNVAKKIIRKLKIHGNLKLVTEILKHFEIVLNIYTNTSILGFQRHCSLIKYQKVKIQIIKLTVVKYNTTDN